MQPSLFRRVIRRIATLAVTILVIGAAAAAVNLGAAELRARAEAARPTGTAEPLQVRVTRLRSEDGYAVTRRFQGEVAAARATDMAFEFAGPVRAVLVDEGDRIRRGQLIAWQDTALLEAEIARLEASRRALAAQLAFSESTAGRREALQQRGFAATETLDQAMASVQTLRANIDETDAALRGLALRIEKARILAPYDGQVGARHADPGAVLGSGQPVVTLLAEAAPELRVGLPLDVTLNTGDRVEVEIAGGPRHATLAALRPDVDPRTRTRTAIFRLDGPAIYGQSATVILPHDLSEPGTWVPLRALRAGAQGMWTVLVVDEARVVRPAAVEVLHSDSARAYVRGSFAEGALLIAEGAHRVTPGQTVRLIAEH